MIAATVTPPTSGATSLRDLINAATFQIMPSATGRVQGINLQWVNGVVNVYYRNNPGAGDEGFVLDTNNRNMLLGQKPHLNLSLDEVFLGGSSSPSVRVTAWPGAAGSDDVITSPPLTGLALWLKADAITGLVDNDPVATWVDSSGSSNDATQATAGLRPLYKTSILNGKPVVRFDGTDDGMITPNNVFNVAPMSVFVVYSKNADPPLNSTRALQGRDANWLIGPFSQLYTAYNGSFINECSRVLGDFVFSTVIDAGGTFSFWNDGTFVGSAVTSAKPGRIALAASGVFSEPLNGDIAEVLGYTADMTAQRADIEAYLRFKYAI